MSERPPVLLALSPATGRLVLAGGAVPVKLLAILSKNGQRNFTGSGKNNRNWERGRGVGLGQDFREQADLRHATGGRKVGPN